MSARASRSLPSGPPPRGSLLRDHPSHRPAEGPSSHPQAATLEFRNVSKTYEGSGEPAIQDLSFEVPAGEICVLVGPSGCGKTTAMRLVNRMIEMTSGDILLDGVSVRTRRPAELRREIGYAIQQIGLFPHQTIAENIATVPRVLGWPRERIRARVDELIELIGLDPADTRDRYPAQLSGGQRQRVGVARALAADPPLMLMDEPFGAIDPINRERLQDELLRLQERIRKTIVFVTHDIDEAIKLGDRIAVLKKGGVLAQYATAGRAARCAPADEFVEDFVGADRALKRLALTRAGEVDLRPVDDGLPFALVRDEAGRPVAWERGGERHPVRTVRCDESLRDALSDLLASPVELGAVVDDEGRVKGVLGLEVIHELLAARGGRGGVSVPTLLAQAGSDFFRDRSRSGDSCVANNGFCPDWIVHHLDRYVSPFWQHLFLVVVSVGLGFAIAFALALAAHRQRRAASARSPRSRGSSTRSPASPSSSCCCRSPAAGTRRRSSPLTAYTLLILFRNIVDGLDGVPEEARDAGRGMGLTDRQLLWRVELPLALPAIIAGLRIAATTTVGLAALATFAGAGGLGDQMASQKEFISNIAVGGALCVLMAFGLDAILLVTQRLLTPWTRVRTA